MGIISFLKGAGSKLFGKSEEEREKDKAVKIMNHIKSYGFSVENLNVSVDDETVILAGKVDSMINKNKIIVIAGNVEGISKVEDRMTVIHPVKEPEKPAEVAEPQKQFYTVVPGDNLSKIAKQVYGNANKYPVIFEANKPMLKHPDKIYPGQVLVIPPLD
jgi:nucleoid-associated protein YgaU